MVSAEVAGEEVVLFRGEDGAVRAASAFCPHMGAHLGHAKVEGNALRCPLHARRVEGGCFRAEERFGLVFVTREGFDGALPEVQNADDFVFSAGAPVDVNVPWANFVLNGFDVPHLEAVHHRRLRAPVVITREKDRVRLRYETSITGRGPSDLAMKWLSKDHVRAQMSCFGTVGIVEADLGWTRSVLICGVTPKTATQDPSVSWPTGGSRAWVSFGVPRNALAPKLRALVTQWLYLAFLGRDFVVLEKQRLSVRNVDDESTLAVAEFLTSREDWCERGR